MAVINQRANSLEKLKRKRKKSINILVIKNLFEKIIIQVQKFTQFKKKKLFDSSLKKIIFSKT